MPRPRLPKTMWNEDSIRVEVRPAGVVDEPSNVEIFQACLNELNETRLRIMVGCYGPGSEARPKPRYSWLLGESATVHCRDLDSTNWFREELLKWLKSLDGVRLEAVEDNDA
jgi:hypothetical protein